MLNTLRLIKTSCFAFFFVYSSKKRHGAETAAMPFENLSFNDLKSVCLSVYAKLMPAHVRPL
jgi:hypothetical protein